MDLLALLGSARDLALVVFGFGMIVFIHEAGHFLAAKWAGIRVLAFSIGFGAPILSYRKGMGLCRGSSELAYIKLERTGKDAVRGISPTEYRLNWLPLGGYVKMLGQEDLNPDAVSNESDSYQNCSVPKRMVVISAGVVANLILAASLFVIVFLVGLRAEPALVGATAPGSPAAEAIALNAESLGLEDAHLQGGDKIVLINGHQPDTFTDLMTAAAMAGPGKPVRLSVQREGINEPIRFEITPKQGELTGLLEVGIEPARSNRVVDIPKQNDLIRSRLAKQGLKGVEPGAKLIAADQSKVLLGNDIASVYRESDGNPVELEFANPGGGNVLIRTQPLAQLEVGLAPLGSDRYARVEHLLGLTPVMMVANVSENMPGYKQGLRTGDIFVQIGPIEYPSMAEGIERIKAARRGNIDMVVLRDGQEVQLSVTVSRAGLVGFNAGDTALTSTLLARPPSELATMVNGSTTNQVPAADLIRAPGTRITSVAGIYTASLLDVRAALREATLQAHTSNAETTTVAIALALPVISGQSISMETTWTLDREAISRLHTLSWIAPFSLSVFDLEQTLIKADGPVAAIGKGMDRTRQVMVSTYLTLARLFQGTVKVEHLKGPIGIAHIGTRIAERGFIWLLFFGALVSVNLAVINFLPIPIVDGGQFLLLLAEGIRRKPVPIAFQNAVTLAGLALIGVVFVIVTFNDITNLLGP